MKTLKKGKVEKKKKKEQNTKLNLVVETKNESAHYLHPKY